MGEVKHTPGPWTDKTEVLIRGNNGPRIAFINCEPGSKTDREARANLLLIAAAPDMLAALKALMTDETADRVEYLINEREGGDCTIIKAMEIAFEVVGVEATLAAVEGH